MRAEDWDGQDLYDPVMGASDEDDFPTVFPHGDVDLSFTEPLPAQQQVTTRP